MQQTRIRLFLLMFFLFYAVVALAQKTDSLPSRVYLWDSLKVQKQNSWISRSIMTGSTTSLSRFEVTAITLEPGKKAPAPSVYDDVEELVIVKEGQVKIVIGDVARKMGAGSIAFAMPRMVHSVSNEGNTNATYYVLKYKGNQPMDNERAKRAGGSLMLDWNELGTTKHDKGYRRDFFNRPTSQLAQFEMHTTALNTGEESHLPHRHVHEEIVLILRGNVEMYIDGDRLKASAGDLVFLSSLVPHSLTNTGDVQCEYFAFQWRN